MAAQPYRSTITIDGTKFDAVSTVVVFQTDKDRAGMPQMGSLKTQIFTFVDFHDDTNLPYSALNKLFDLANVVTRDKVKDMKVEFWKDDAHQDALCSYSFKGWISGFHTCNPPHGNVAGADPSDVGNVNHLLELHLEPAMNQQNFQDITMGN